MAFSIGTLAPAHVPAPTPSNAVQEINQRLGQLEDRLEMVLDRLERVPQRAFGTPQLEQSEGPAAVPCGELGVINGRLESLDALASRLEKSCSEIDKIV